MRRPARHMVIGVNGDARTCTAKARVPHLQACREHGNRYAKRGQDDRMGVAAEAERVPCVIGSVTPSAPHPPNNVDVRRKSPPTHLCTRFAARLPPQSGPQTSLEPHGVCRPASVAAQLVSTGNCLPQASRPTPTCSNLFGRSLVPRVVFSSCMRDCITPEYTRRNTSGPICLWL